MTADRDLGYKEYKCQKCGWVHAAIPRSALPQDGSLGQYLRCFQCHAPSFSFAPAAQGDAPVGCTLQPIFVPRAWGEE